MNHAMITQPLNTKLLLKRKPELESKPRVFNDTNFMVFQPQSSTFCNINFGSLKANYVWRKMGENREKIVLVISRNKRELPHWYIIQNCWSWFEKIMPL